MEGAHGKGSDGAVESESGSRMGTFLWTLYEMKIIMYYFRGL